MTTPIFTDFGILPPPHAVEHVLNRVERLKAHLTQQFPGFNFSIIDPGKINDYEGPESDQFMVFPALRLTGDDGPFQMPRQPEPEFIKAIMDECDRFVAFTITIH